MLLPFKPLRSLLTHQLLANPARHGTGPQLCTQPGHPAGPQGGTSTLAKVWPPQHIRMPGLQYSVHPSQAQSFPGCRPVSKQSLEKAAFGLSVILTEKRVEQPQVKMGKGRNRSTSMPLQRCWFQKRRPQGLPTALIPTEVQSNEQLQ